MLVGTSDNNRFSLKDSGIFVYGYGGRGRLIGEDLAQAGYDLKGYIDRDPARYPEESLPIYTLDDFAKMGFPSRTVIIVSLQSGMQHDPIAAKLNEKGFGNIVYCPIALCASYEYRHDMRAVYQKVISGEFDTIGDIPTYSVDKEASEHKIIRKSSGHVSFWCPLSMIHHCSYGMRLENEGISPEHYEILKKYSDCTIDGYRPYRDLYRYLDGEDVDISEYFKACEVNKERREEWLRSRAELYEVFNDALIHDLTFFTDSPTPCIWDEGPGTCGGGFLVIDEGATRAHFLVHKGYKEIPVTVSASDWKGMIENAKKDQHSASVL